MESMIYATTTCGACGEEMTGSKITDSCFYGDGADAEALAYLSSRGEYMHLHGVRISRLSGQPRRGRLAALARKWAR